MNWKKAHSALLDELDALGPSPSRRELLAAVQHWLQSHLATFSSALQESYGLRSYAALDLLQYPVDSSALDAPEEARQLRLVPPTSVDVLAMRVRDVFWPGLTLESGIQCPRCQDSELCVLIDPSSQQLVRACDRCGWAETRSGEAWQPGSPLVPPTLEQLEHWAAADRSTPPSSPPV